MTSYAEDRCRLRTAMLMAGCLSYLAGCGGGGGDGDVIVLADQGPRTDHDGVDTADMNQDGLADIVVAASQVNQNQGQDQGYIDVYFQDSLDPGSFKRQRFPVPSFPTYVKAADLDRDGLPDVVASMRFSSDEFVVLLNDAVNPGELGPAQSYSTTANPGHVGVADLDQDGLVDIVTAGEKTLVLHRQLAGGGFGRAELIGPGTKSVAIADFNRDMVPDLVTIEPADDFDGPEENIRFYRNRSAMPGAFASPVTIETSISLGLGQVAAGDLDDDGLVDIAAVGLDVDSDFDFFGSWYSITQDGADPPSFAIASRDNTASQVWSIEIADLDGDGRDDVAVGTGTAADPHRVYVFLQLPGGRFDNGTAYRLPEVTVSNLEFYALSAADLNNDTLPDLAAGNSELFVLFQDPRDPGAFRPPVRLASQR